MTGAPLKAVPPMTPAPKPKKSGPRARTPMKRSDFPKSRREFLGYCGKCGCDVVTDYCEKCQRYVQASPHDTSARARTPIARTRMKTRSTRSKKSGGHLFPKGVDEGLRAFVRGERCILYGSFTPRDWHYGDARPIVWHKCTGGTEACHVKNRGAGGVDRNNLYPGCAWAHDEQHRIGIRSFEKRWDIDLKAEAVKLWREYQGLHEQGNQ